MEDNNVKDSFLKKRNFILNKRKKKKSGYMHSADKRKTDQKKQRKNKFKPEKNNQNLDQLLEIYEKVYNGELNKLEEKNDGINQNKIEKKAISYVEKNHEIIDIKEKTEEFSFTEFNANETKPELTDGNKSSQKNLTKRKTSKLKDINRKFSISYDETFPKLNKVKSYCQEIEKNNYLLITEDVLETVEVLKVRKMSF